MEAHMKAGRALRKEKVYEIVEKFNVADSLIFNDYRGLSVPQIGTIRKALREKGATIHVHKNRLAKHAVREKKYDSRVEEYLSGPTAIAYVKGDASPILKILFQFIKQEYPIAVRGAYVDNVVLNATDAEKLSKLPGREELLAMLLATLNAPVQNVAAALHDVIVRFVRVLSAIGDTKT